MKTDIYREINELMITHFSGFGQYDRNEQLSIPSSSPSTNSTIIDIQSPALNMELGAKLRPRMKKWEQTTLSNEDLQLFQNLDEEVLGIITLEDVMEELLQVFLSLFYLWRLPIRDADI